MCWWLLTVILATWEVEVGRKVVPGQHGEKKVCKTTSQLKKAGFGVVGLSSQLQEGSVKIGLPVQNNQSKKGWRHGSSGRVPRSTRP
jgi:hypothetical protein